MGRIRSDFGHQPVESFREAHTLMSDAAGCARCGDASQVIAHGWSGHGATWPIALHEIRAGQAPGFDDTRGDAPCYGCAAIQSRTSAACPLGGKTG